MFHFPHLSSLLGKVYPRKPRRCQTTRPRRRVLLTLEALEDRVVPSGEIPGPQLLVTPAAAANQMAFPPAPKPDNVETTAQDVTVLYQTKPVTLSAIVADTTNPNNFVAKGVVTFTVVDSTGAQITSFGVNVTTGTVNADKTVTVSKNIALPANQAVGTYTINVAFSNGGSFYTDAGDTAGTLTITARNTTTNANNVSVAFTPGARTITLKATVTDATPAPIPKIVVDEGTVSFSIQGTNVQANFVAVNKGTASTTVQLPAGLAPGTYNISAVYADVPANFNGSQDTATLTIKPAKVKTTAAPASATCSTNPQTIDLSASVADSDDANVTVNQGTVTFNVAGIGSVQGTVSNGTASASITVPGGQAAGSYAITVSYSDSAGDFTDAGDTGSALTIGNCATSATDSASRMAQNLGNYVSNLQSQLAQSAQSVLNTLSAVINGQQPATNLLQPLIQFYQLYLTIQEASQAQPFDSSQFYLSDTLIPLDRLNNQ